MFSFSLRGVLLSAAVPTGLYLASVAAQAQPMPSETNAKTATSSVSTLQYSSAISGYQGYKDQPVNSWKEVNDTVGKVGGWKVYAKEAREPDAAPAAAEGSATPKTTASQPTMTMPGGSMNHGGKP